MLLSPGGMRQHRHLNFILLPDKNNARGRNGMLDRSYTDATEKRLRLYFSSWRRAWIITALEWYIVDVMEANDANVRTLALTFIAGNTNILAITPAPGCPCRLLSTTGSELLFVVLIINIFLATGAAIAATTTTAAVSAATTAAADAAAGELH